MRPVPQQVHAGRAGPHHRDGVDEGGHRNGPCWGLGSMNDVGSTTRSHATSTSASAVPAAPSLPATSRTLSTLIGRTLKEPRKPSSAFTSIASYGTARVMKRDLRKRSYAPVT